MQSPDCSVNHLQPLTIREQAEQEANSERLLCSQLQMLPCQCSSHITLLSPSLSLLSPRAAPAVILQKTAWVFILVSHCPWPSYSQAWSCQTALQNPSTHITKLLSDLLSGFAFAFQINSGVFTLNMTFIISSIHSSLSGSCQRLLSLKSLFKQWCMRRIKLLAGVFGNRLKADLKKRKIFKGTEFMKSNLKKKPCILKCFKSHGPQKEPMLTFSKASG